MLRINPRPTRTPALRIDSDRDALPFPNGGVHGSTTDGRTDITTEVMAHLEQAQLRLNTLSHQFNESAEADLHATRSVIGRIHAGHGSFPPAAA